MPRSPHASTSSLSRYQYALTGGAMLILAVAGIGMAYTQPFAEAILRPETDDEDAILRYSITGLEVMGQDGEEEMSLTQRYRDERFDGTPGFSSLRLGFWMVPMAGLLYFGAALAMFAAPSSSIAAARGGAVAGILGGLALIVAVSGLAMGFTDHSTALQAAFQGEDIQRGTAILPGGAFLGAALILGLGGAMLGFSDKPAKTAPRPRAAPCPECSHSVPSGQAFCGGCGTSVA